MSWLVVKAASPPLEGVSFATDLLLSYEDVRKRVEKSSKVYEEMILFVKARAAVEESYAEGLRKVAQMSLSPHKKSSMNEAVEALRSNLLNKATQHSLLSSQLMACEILEEVSEHQKKSSARAKSLNQLLAHFNKEMKTLEDKYRLCSRKYAKAWHESCIRCAEYKTSSASKTRRPSMSPPRSSISPSRSSPETMKETHKLDNNLPSNTKLGGNTAPAAALAGVVGGQDSKASLTSSTIPQETHAHDKEGRTTSGTSTVSSIGTTGQFAQWLMPTSEERLNLANEHLEETRIATMNTWQKLVGAQQRCCLKLQEELSEMQRCEELGGECLRDLMRTCLVFESSVIANTVYDMENATAPKVNEFEPLKDILNFIIHVRSKCSLHDEESVSNIRKHSSDVISDDVNELFVDHVHVTTRKETPNHSSIKTEEKKADDKIPLDGLSDSNEKQKLQEIEREGIIHTCGGLSLNVPLLTRAGSILPRAPLAIKKGSGLMFPPPVESYVNPQFHQFKNKLKREEDKSSASTVSGSISGSVSSSSDSFEADFIPLPSTNPWSLPEWKLPVLVSIPQSIPNETIKLTENQQKCNLLTESEAEQTTLENKDNADDSKKSFFIKDCLLSGEKMQEMVASIQSSMTFQDCDHIQEVYRPPGYDHSTKEANTKKGSPTTSASSSASSNIAAAASGTIAPIKTGGVSGSGGGGVSGGGGGGSTGISSFSEGSKVKTLSTPINHHTFFGSLYRKNGVIMPSKAIKTVQPWRSLTGIRIIEKVASGSAANSFSDPKTSQTSEKKSPKYTTPTTSNSATSTSNDATINVASNDKSIEVVPGFDRMKSEETIEINFEMGEKMKVSPSDTATSITSTATTPEITTATATTATTPEITTTAAAATAAPEALEKLETPQFLEKDESDRNSWVSIDNATNNPVNVESSVNSNLRQSPISPSKIVDLRD